MKFAIPKKLIIAGTALVEVVAAACSHQVGSAPLNGPQNQTNTIAFVADTGPGPSPIFEPDVLYQAELDGARFDRRVWDTDFSRHTVPFEDIFSGGVGWDGIPPIDAPRFWTIEEADPVMDDFEPAAIVNQVEPLKKLLETRNKLRDLSTKADRSDELESILERVLNSDTDLSELAAEIGAEKED